MTGLLRVSTIILLSLIGFHSAQAQSSAPSASGPQSTPDANTSVSATGKRMPGVGESKSGGETPVEKKAEQKMNKDTTICNGC